MRILQIHKDYAPVVGGVENHIRLLAEGLQDAGQDVRILVTNRTRHRIQEIVNGVAAYKAARWLAISSAPISGPFFQACGISKMGSTLPMPTRFILPASWASSSWAVAHVLW